MALKIPPPPFMTGPQWQAFNRWLLEVTSILTNQGGIDPSEVAGLPELFLDVAANTAAIAGLGTTQGTQAAQIATINGQIIALGNAIATINGQITSLSARAQVFNGIADPAAGVGNVGDWFANTAGAAGHRIFIKTAVGVWTAFPF